MTASKIETFWATIAGSPDFPKEIAKEIDSHIAIYHRSVKLWEAKRNALQTLMNDLRNTEQKAVINLLQELATGTKNTIEKTSQNITELSDAVTDAQRQERFTSAAMRRAEAQISSPTSKHRDALTVWIASLRAVEPYACGYTQSITKEIEELWRNLGVFMFQPFDQMLELPPMNRLPIVFESGWGIKSRSSIAYLWSQMALGNFDYPNRNRQPKATPKMRFTAYIESIPQAPAIPAHR
jgi:predicted nucleic acid-binding protein